MTDLAQEITLHQPLPAFGVPNPSPFCLKLEIWLRMAGVPFRTALCFNPRKGPTGKIPFITLDGEAIGDSEIIMATLRERRGIDLDRGLSEAERGVAHAFARLADEHLYWVIIYSRWMDDAVFPDFSRQLFAKMPAPLRVIAPPLLRRKVRRSLHIQGLGRHDPKTIYAKGEEDLAATAGYLGDKPFLMGETPRTVDASAFAMVTSIIDANLDTPLKVAAARYPTLAAYTARVRERYYAGGKGSADS
jgi:glutathione S-transferase